MIVSVIQQSIAQIATGRNPVRHRPTYIGRNSVASHRPTCEIFVFYKGKSHAYYNYNDSSGSSSAIFQL
jgi:hypothetical protein